MMHPKMSERALRHYVDEYIAELRKQMTSELNGDAVRVLAAVYRKGWRDADSIFRSWEDM
jgi:hypothetical protein